MGKIWLKAPDSSKTCSGCEGKSGPCDGGCPYFNIIFDTVEKPGIPKNTIGITNFNKTSPQIDEFELGLKSTIAANTFATTPRDFVFLLNVKKGEYLEYTVDSDTGMLTQLNGIYLGQTYNLGPQFYGTNAGLIVSRGNYQVGFSFTNPTFINEITYDYYNWKRKSTYVSCPVGETTFVQEATSTISNDNPSPNFQPPTPPIPDNLVVSFIQWDTRDIATAQNFVGNSYIECSAQSVSWRNYSISNIVGPTSIPFSFSYSCNPDGTDDRTYSYTPDSLPAVEPRTVQFSNTVQFDTFFKDIDEEGNLIEPTETNGTCVLIYVSSCTLFLKDKNGKKIDITKRLSQLYPEQQLP